MLSGRETMGKYKGFTCDSCGKVLDETTRTKKRTSFEGPVADGSYLEDLCMDCVEVPDGVNFKPTKRRGSRPTGEGEVTGEGETNGQVAVDPTEGAFIPPGEVPVTV